MTSLSRPRGEPEPLFASNPNYPLVRRLERWGPLVLILIVATVARFALMPYRGEHTDLKIFDSWGRTVYQYGLANVYRLDQSADYPPIYPAMLGIMNMVQASRHVPYVGVGIDSVYRMLLRTPALIGDWLLIIVAYLFLIDQRRLRWLIPGLMAVFPGLILASIWWARPEGLLVLFVAFALIALNRDRPVLAWLLFAVVMLFRLQGIVIAPIMLILTYRRYGLRRLVIGVTAAAVFSAIILLPIALGSGLENMKRLYLGVGRDPEVTINALNVWMIVAPPDLTAGSLDATNEPIDTTHAVGPITYRQLGLVMLGCFSLLVVLQMWREPDKRLEFVWATELYLGFFMLPTEIHEQYLYFASVLALFAVSQDRRFWPIVVGTQFTFIYNINAVVSPPTWWYGVPLYPLDFTIELSLLNVVMLAETIRLLLTPSKQRALRLARPLIRIAAVAVIASIGLTFLLMIPSFATAQWLVNNVADNSSLAFDKAAERPQKWTYIWDNAGQWKWDFITDNDTRSAAAWQGQGVQYLLLSQKAVGQDYSQRLNQLTAHGATLLYRADNALAPGNSFAVLWTFHPDHAVNDKFDGSLSLVG